MRSSSTTRVHQESIRGLVAKLDNTVALSLCPYQVGSILKIYFVRKDKFSIRIRFSFKIGYLNFFKIRNLIYPSKKSNMWNTVTPCPRHCKCVLILYNFPLLHSYNFELTWSLKYYTPWIVQWERGFAIELHQRSFAVEFTDILKDRT